MMTKDRFDETLQRCSSLVESFEGEENGDLLRAAAEEAEEEPEVGE